MFTLAVAFGVYHNASRFVNYSWRVLVDAFGRGLKAVDDGFPITRHNAV